MPHERIASTGRRPTSRSGWHALIAPSTLGACLVAVATLSYAEPPASTADSAYRAGLGFLERGQHALALTELEIAMREMPADAPLRATALYAQAICLAELTRTAEARATLERLFTALSAPASQASAFEFSADARVLAARLAFDARDYAAAAHHAERLLAGKPQRTQEAFALLVAGESRLRTGEHRIALEWLDRLLSLAPEPATLVRAARMAAHAAAALGDDAGVIRRIASAMDAAPRDERPGLSLLLAQAHHRSGSLQPALDAYRIVLAADPDQPDALLGFAQTTRALGKPGSSGHEAMDALDRLIAAGTREPASPAGSLLAAARIERAAGALDAADGELARRLLEGPAPAPPLRTAFLMQRARADAATGRRAEAIETIDLILRDERDPAIVRALRIDRAAHLFALERWADAAEATRSLLGMPDMTDRSLRGTLLLRAGIAHARLGRTSDARRDLADALASLPLDAALERELALSESLALAFAAEDWEASATLAEQLGSATDDADRKAGALLRGALAAARLERFDSALASLGALLALPLPADAPTILRARMERAQILLRNNRASDATTDLRAVADSADAALAPIAREQLVHLLLQQGDAAAHDEARARLGDATGDALVDRAIAESASGEHARALATLTHFIDTEPTGRRVAEALARRAIVRARLGDHRGTLADIGALGERTLSLEPMLRAALELDHGIALVALGKPDDARTPLAAAMRIASPYRPLAAAELARLALESERLDEAATALDHLESVLTEAPPGDRNGLNERARYMRALVAARSGDHASAARILRTLLAEHGQGSLARPARLLLGESLLRSGAPAEAAESLAALLAEDATLPEPTRDAVRLRVGEAWAAAGRWIESERAYADFVRDRATEPNGEGHPLASQARFGVGWAREQRGELDGAIIAYREVTARSEDATAARAQFQIGECLFAQGKVDEAIRELLKVEILYAAEEWSSAALFEAGRCYASLGRHADARAQWARLLERYATTRWAALAQAELDRASTEPSAPPSTTSSLPRPAR